MPRLTWKELDEIKSIINNIGLKGAREFLRGILQILEKPKATSVGASTIFMMLRDANILSNHMRLVGREHDEPLELESPPVEKKMSTTSPEVILKFNEVFGNDNYTEVPEEDDIPL